MSYPQIPEPETFEQWEKLNRYHPPIPGQQEIYEENRRRFTELSRYVFETLPPSEERKQTLRQLSFVLMMANQTVAVHSVVRKLPPQ